MLDYLYSVDIKILYFINHDLSNPIFDLMMPIVRQKAVWIPLYLILLGWIFKKYGLKSLWVVAFGLLTVLLCDQLSAGLIKPLVQRLRPCHNELIASWLLLPAGKGHGWSFVSSHATNHFGLAVYFSMVFMGYYNRFRILIPFLLWASLIAFAQVYTAYHYPSDVLAGGLLGAAVGYAMAKLNCLVLCYRSGNQI